MLLTAHFGQNVLAALFKDIPELSKKSKRDVAYILNPAPEGERFMPLLKAELLVARGKAEWTPGTNQLYILRDGVAEVLRLEQAARYRRDGERYVDHAIWESRFGSISWSGASRRNVPAFERSCMAPVTPGTVRS